MADYDAEGNAASIPSKVRPPFKRVRNQFLIAFVGNLLALSHGTNLGWYSPALPILQSDQSPLLDGSISQETAGWIGSFVALGAIVGSLTFGLIGNWIGYKRSMQLATIPIITSWLLIIFAQYSWHITLSRLMNGLSGGAAYTCLPQFVAEIATDSIRGQLNSFIQIACYAGILVGFIGGSYLPYDVNPIVMLSIPLVYFVGFYWMPESPQFLLKNDRVDEAEKSLRFYRNVKSTDDKQSNQIVEEEFEKFKAIAKQNDQQPPLRISDFVNPVALRAMMICPFLMLVNQFSGAFAISTYAETIFKSTGSTFDPQISSIVMAGVQVIGAYTASQLIDRVGRKVLLLISLSGSCVALTITGTYTYLVKNDQYDVSAFSWIPVVFISIFVFLVAIGILPVPYVMLAEVIPQRIRRIATTCCTSIIFTGQMTMLRIMPIVLHDLDLYGSMWMFAGVSLIGLVFTIVIVKETKGKNLDVLAANPTNK